MIRRRAWLQGACGIATGGLVALSGCSRKPSHATELRVAAASDLARPLAALAPAFEARSGARVVASFGSSGLLSRQIAEGAPFDVFASADESFVDRLVRGGHALGDTRAPYARGRLIVLARAGIAPPARLAELADPRFARVAIANPEHAPYGRAAKQALERAGLLSALGSRLVFGESVQQAAEHARTGNADAAIVSGSLATPGRTCDVDASLHDPLVQAVVVTSQARDPALARAFVAFLLSAEGRAIFAAHGLDAPLRGAPAHEPERVYAVHVKPLPGGP